MEFHLVQNLKENCHDDLIAFNLKGNGILVFSVYHPLGYFYVVRLTQSGMNHCKTILYYRNNYLSFLCTPSSGTAVRLYVYTVSYHKLSFVYHDIFFNMWIIVKLFYVIATNICHCAFAHIVHIKNIAINICHFSVPHPLGQQYACTSIQFVRLYICASIQSGEAFFAH